MEDHRENTQKSDEIKSETLLETSSLSEFEFGSLTPSSPSQDPFLESSPADHFFLNGRLLPHYFPASTTMTTRSMSRTTSENTYRSNSTSSRSTDSSTPTSYTPITSTCNIFKITSLSEKEKTKLVPRFEDEETLIGLRSGICRRSKEQRVLDSKKKLSMNNGKTVNTSKTKKVSYLPQCKRKKATEIVTAQLYGPYSRRWQHITPVFKREVSVKRNGGGIKVGERRKMSTTRRRKKKTKKVEEKRGISKLMKWWKKILKAVVFACRECHAMEPQVLVNHDVVDLKKKKIKCT